MLYRVPGTKITLPYHPKLTPAEIRLLYTLEKFFPPDQIFPDCYLPKPDPRTLCDSRSTFPYQRSASNTELVQIDCLVISERGIFVFESKDYQGWIYGNAEHKTWTQVLNFGREKHHFYSPIHQNSTHIASLPQELTNSHLKIYSIIVFGRNTTLKIIENLPENCYVCTQATLRPLMQNLLSSNVAPLSVKTLAELKNLLEHSFIAPTDKIRQDHKAEVQLAAKS